MQIYSFINQSINTLSKRKDNQIMLCADCAKYGCEFSSYSSFQKPQTQKQPSGEGNCLILLEKYSVQMSYLLQTLCKWSVLSFDKSPMNHSRKTKQGNSERPFLNTPSEIPKFVSYLLKFTLTFWEKNQDPSRGIYDIPSK